MKRVFAAIFLSTMLGAAAAQLPAQETEQLPMREALMSCRDVGDGCRQAVAVVGGSDSQCSIFFFAREENSPAGEWTCLGTCRGTAGINGMVDAERKREGDGCTPCGAYNLRRGLWRTADIDTKLAMELYDEGCVWIDDPAREDYNTLVHGVDAQADAHGERLADIGEPYDYIVVVEYNTQPVKAGAGSAIFLHVWRGEGMPTAGCVAMPREDMRRMIEWLDPQQKPMIVITDIKTNKTNKSKIE